MLYKQVFFLNGVFPAEHLEYVEYVMCVVRVDVKLSVLLYQLEIRYFNRCAG